MAASSFNSAPNATFDLATTLAKLAGAVQQEKITRGAQQNIQAWLTERRYARYAPEVADHIAREQWQILDDVFWTVIPFGTGGRRGKMYPIGSNAINDRTIGESAQGLANYIKETVPGPHSCGIAFDTRHRSREFAQLCAGIMVAAGFKVYLLDEIRSTPELSFLVRYRGCSCGIMVTASHNPPSDNAVKAYWSTGGQILPPHDKGVIDRVMSTQDIEVADFDQSVVVGKIELCKEEVDTAFISALKRQAFPGPRQIKILYSPLHGVGGTAVLPALAADQFHDVETFAPHAAPDGDFPNVPGHVSNPENVVVFDAMISHARQVGADLILATDPDCDRLGCAAPCTTDVRGAWGTFSGNQIAVLLTDYLLQQRQQAGTLSPDHYVVKTLVTTEMMRRIADAYDVRTEGNLQVGFKWIGGVMDEKGPDKFVFGAEESHGYLVGQYARDKDGAVASMLFAELAAVTKARGISLHQYLDELYVRHGYHAERLVTQTMPGSEGMALMKSLMNRFRQHPPQSLGGIHVAAIRDYQSDTVTVAGGKPAPLHGPRGDMVIIDLADSGTYIAARPSGTEPKVKFYMFTRLTVSLIQDLDSVRAQAQNRLDAIQRDLQEYATGVGL